MDYYCIDEIYNKERKFIPYDKNTGNIVAIAGENFVIFGADTRLSFDLSIFTRDQKKLFQLTDRSVLGLTGFWGDALALHEVVMGRKRLYEYENEKKISTPALAQMLVTILYFKRFFPYGVSPILAGLDENGRGCVYTYDCVGHCERSMFGTTGSAGPSIQPLLDNQIGLNNMPHAAEQVLGLEQAKALLKDAFICASERDVFTGDNIQILHITRSGITEESFELRKD